MKSAWEIAREKASRLGALSAAERRKQREDSCRMLGSSLADKFLSQHDAGYLQMELDRHSGEDRELVRQAIVERLVEAIDLKYPQLFDEINRSLLLLAGDSAAAGTLAGIEDLFLECRAAEDAAGAEIEKAGSEILHQTRVSGTAVGRVNIRATEEWRERLDRVFEPFEKRLNELKQKLLGKEAPAAGL